MSANRKTVFRGYDYLRCDDFAKFLGEMAAKGWHFKEWGVGLKFEKGEPENATYAVEVFSGASENDMRPEPHTKEFAEYCEAAGWKLIDARQKFCIFKKIGADAVEILTPEERVTNAYKSLRNSILPLCIIYGLNMLLQWFNMFSEYMFSQDRIFSGQGLFNVVIWTVLFLMGFGRYVHLLIWKHKMKKKVLEGAHIYLGVEEYGKKKIDWSLCSAIALLVGTPVFLYAIGSKEMLIIYLITLVLFVGFALIISKVRPESNTNFFIQVGFAFFVVFGITFFVLVMMGEEDPYVQTEAPLYVADYREDIGEVKEITRYYDENILGARKSYILEYEDNYLFYNVYTSKIDWIMDKIWGEQFDKKVNEIREDCTSDWDAEIAYRNKIGEYYVRYDDTIFILVDCKDLRLTKEQIDIIREKLELR